jgi:hypothetical protein
MERLKINVFAFLIFVILFAEAAAQTTLPSSEQSTAGGSAQSANFTLVASTFGQPVSGNVASSAQFSLLGGFIPTTVDELEVNLPPAITHTATTTVAVNQDITISATIADAGGLNSATLKFRRAGDNAFSSANMTQSGSTFSGTIPAASVTDRGVEYFIEALDLGGLSDREPASGFFSVQVTVPDPGVVKSTSQPAGSTQTGFRLISIPFDADAKSANAVLVDDLGAYDDTEWRFFELRPNASGGIDAGNNQSYAEFPNVGNLVPGKAFWLIVRAAGKIIDTGAGRSSRTDNPFAINLTPGWNFVGSPFTFAIPLSKVRLGSGANLDIRTFNGEFVAFTGALQPFDGYAVFRNAADQLLIDPLLGSATASTQKELAADFEHNWSLRISAHIQNARDTQTLAAVRSDAAIGWDEFDLPEAPVIGEYVSVYFPHPEWGQIASNYTTDVRPEPLDGEIWEFAVRTNIRDVVTLTFQPSEGLAPEIYLVDEALKIKINLLETNSYTVAGDNERHPKRLKLLVGTREFIGDELGDLSALPATFELAQNFPNPFNPTTTIRFGLPRESRVTLKIYNLLGEEIATLVDETRPAGFHAAVWDGRNQAGQSAASGVYVYQLAGDGVRLTRKLLMLK